MSSRPQETVYEPATEDYPSEGTVELLDRFNLPEMDGYIFEPASKTVINEQLVYKYNNDSERLEICKYFNQLRRVKRKRKRK